MVNQTPLKISVVVCSYLRSSDLVKCLSSLEKQTRPADEVLVVLRRDDVASQQAVQGIRTCAKVLLIEVEGVIAATNLALRTATGDIVAFTDDDAQPWPDWLERIEEIYARSAQIGAVGGRDRLHVADRPDFLEARSARVGVLTKAGELCGFHHCITPWRERPVHFLKGVNFSLRRSALGGAQIDETLHGRGAQPAWEIDLCFSILERDYLVIYSQAVGVEHYPAPRLSFDNRAEIEALGGDASVFNPAYLIFKRAPRWERRAFFMRSFFYGGRVAPGVFLLVVLLLLGDRGVIRRFQIAQRCLFSARRAARSARRNL